MVLALCGGGIKTLELYGGGIMALAFVVAGHVESCLSAWV